MANNKSKSKRRRVVISIIALLVVAGLLCARFLRRDPAIPVTAEKAARRNITEVVVANGKVEPVLQVKISPEVSGEIIELKVKEGQDVIKGELLFKIKPDNYAAARDSAQANYKSSIANRDTAAANLEKAALEYERNKLLFQDKLISESDFLAAKTAYDVGKTALAAAAEQISIARGQLDNAQADLYKTTVYSPLTGTVSKLNSELGERVVGTAQMAGTEVMTVADLNAMEARVDIGEVDVPSIKVGQKATLEVDAFPEQKFSGIVTEIANSANNNETPTTGSVSTTSTEATKFQVRMRVTDKKRFLPGMSVTANIETRYRANVLSVPIQSVTTRLPAQTNAPAATNFVAANKADQGSKPVEVVFLVEGDHAKMAPVKRGINDDNYTEITDGLREGQEVISGGYKAISHDLEDGKKIVVNAAAAVRGKETRTY